MGVADFGRRVETSGVADSAKSRGRRCEVRAQYRLDRSAEAQVGKAHDPRRDSRVAISAARTLSCDTIDELGLAHRLHRWVAVGAVHRHAFDEDGSNHAMAGASIVQDLVEQIAAAGMVPKMMMRIDNRQRRFEWLFDNFGDPGFSFSLSTCRHLNFSLAC